MLCRHLLAAPFLALILGGLPAISMAGECPRPGEWQRGGVAVPADALMRELASQRVVLLGEQHERLAHHRWQLHTLAALHAHQPAMAIGLEMLPRKAQPALDAWVAGELNEAAFLSTSDWHEAWGYDPDLYLPILHFARMNRIPLVALNVTPELRRRLSTQGWEKVASEERHGLTPPATPPPDYVGLLTELYASHPSELDTPGGLERFIDAQLVWDRAMAEGLASAAERVPLVVGLIGEGHLKHDHGVPHQLEDLGLDSHRTLLAWSTRHDCPPSEGVADVLFGLGDESPYEPAAPLRLGVLILPDEAGVRVARVEADSVAADSGLREGDIITAAAGREVVAPGELIARVSRQAPGTLLPLTIKRNGEAREILARFPAEAL
ncbi:ChaN family lipoprotein [Halomonas marinisediminis]|uniref:PDZ domain-containing protein n=1 Tax=Halomonas marinisediminis TaxID=2546095 RepID=A0ABY2DAN5_9GAMM|nr:ChaN family lipoprotein [Halomonas marinisediminis]TDB02949.1 PDZ domain-containing protein [Halomonas marinisediminis]